MKKEEIIKILKQFKKLNKAKYRFKKIGLFGSIARGEGTERSDIDIIIEQISPDLFLLAHVKTDLEELFKKRVDVIRLRENMNPYLYQRIQRDAIYV